MPSLPIDNGLSQARTPDRVFHESHQPIVSRIAAARNTPARSRPSLPRRTHQTAAAVEYDREGAIAVVRLNRPAKLNANADVVREHARWPMRCAPIPPCERS